MAKTPDDKNKKKPQDEAIEGLEELTEVEAADLPPPPPAPPPAPPIPTTTRPPSGTLDSSVDFSLPGGGEGVDLSGVSVIEWASLVQEPGGRASDSGIRSKSASPSDADLLAQLSEPPVEAAPPAPPEARAATVGAEDALGDLPPPGEHSSSVIDIGPPDVL